MESTSPPPGEIKTIITDICPLVRNTSSIAEDVRPCPLFVLSQKEVRDIRQDIFRDWELHDTKPNYHDPGCIGFSPPFDWSTDKKFSPENGITVESDECNGTLLYVPSASIKRSQFDGHLKWNNYKWKWIDGQLNLKVMNQESGIIGEYPEGSPFEFQEDVLLKGEWPNFLCIHF